MEHNTQKNSSKQTREPKNDQHLTQSTHNRNSNNITQLCPESSSFTSHSRVTTTRDHCRKNIKPEFYQPTKSNFQMGYKQKKYKNGEEYNGEWNNNKRHGMGIHQWPDNRIYVGCLVMACHFELIPKNISFESNCMIRMLWVMYTHSIIPRVTC